MTKKLSLGLIAAAFLQFSGLTAADDSQLAANLTNLLPKNMPIEAIQETPMEGVYEVTAGSQSLYVYSHGKFLMIGDLYDADERVNLGDQKKNDRISAAMNEVPESEMIVMGDNTDRYVLVFTDTDCGYCQKFHQNVAELNAKGLRVRYLMFPRAGLNSDSYDEAVSVWCAEDQGRAMTTAKSGGRVEPKECENPVAEQYALGQKIGINGTPTLVLDTGKVIPGYVPVNRLLSEAGMSVN